MRVVRLCLAISILAASTLSVSAVQLVNPLDVLKRSQREDTEFDNRMRQYKAEQQKQEKERAARQKQEEAVRQKRENAEKALQEAQRKREEAEKQKREKAEKAVQDAQRKREAASLLDSAAKRDDHSGGVKKTSSAPLPS